MIIINFKTYPQATGEKAVELAKICQEVTGETGVKIIIGVQTADIYRVSLKVKIPVFAQHFEPLKPGRNTGWTTALSLKQSGASGVFLNHSEHPYPPNFVELEKAVKMAKEEKLEVLVFASNLEIAKRIDKLNPDYIALEEPSLVSGESAMIEKPELKHVIKVFSQSIKSFSLIGAGIRTRQDVIKSLKMGVKGVAFSSGFVKSDDPKIVLQSFASAFK